MQQSEKVNIIQAKYGELNFLNTGLRAAGYVYLHVQVTIFCAVFFSNV